MSTTAERTAELTRLPKSELARMHAVNGGLMGMSTYLKWTKDELISAVLRDESENGGLPWDDEPPNIDAMGIVTWPR